MRKRSAHAPRASRRLAARLNLSVDASGTSTDVHHDNHVEPAVPVTSDVTSTPLHAFQQQADQVGMHQPAPPAPEAPGPCKNPPSSPSSTSSDGNIARWAAANARNASESALSERHGAQSDTVLRARYSRAARSPRMR